MRNSAPLFPVHLSFTTRTKYSVCLLDDFSKGLMCEIRGLLNREIFVQLCHRLNVSCPWLSHIQRRTINEHFPLALWEVWFCSSLGVPIPALIGPSHQCACKAFLYGSYGDHLQTCQTKSAAPQVHEWAYQGGIQIGFPPWLGRSQSKDP